MSERLSPSWRPQRPDSIIDPQVKRMLLVAAGVAGVLMLAVGGYSMLSGGPRHVPVIEADPSPIRVRPANPGGMQLAGADELGGAGSDAEVMAPPPEVPEPQALQAEIKAARQPEPAAAPVAAAPVAAAAPAAAVATPAPVAEAAPEAAVPPPAAAVPPVPKAAPKPVPVTSGKLQVQLAAMQSQAAAMTEWARLSHLMPAAFSGRHPTIERTEVNGKTFWRLRTAGFADTAAATAFCVQVKDKHAGCSIATF